MRVCVCVCVCVCARVCARVHLMAHQAHANLLLGSSAACVGQRGGAAQHAGAGGLGVQCESGAHVHLRACTPADAVGHSDNWMVFHALHAYTAHSSWPCVQQALGQPWRSHHRTKQQLCQMRAAHVHFSTVCQAHSGGGPAATPFPPPPPSRAQQTARAAQPALGLRQARAVP